MRNGLRRTVSDFPNLSGGDILWKEENSMDIVRDAFHDRPLQWVKGKRFLVNPLTNQMPATAPQLLREAAKMILRVGDWERADKIVGEEDRGAILVAAVSLASGLPLGMARWQPSGIQDQLWVDFDCEYTKGRLYLNGVDEDDKVLIVDDMISTGGTVLALIHLVRMAPAEIVDAICLAEKVEYGGVERVKRETGIQVKTIVRVSVAGSRSEVLN
jgi:adenine/guanine phosphoribosyltransferase-like PRPP-binding protein